MHAQCCVPRVCRLCRRFFARPLAELITSQGRDILQSTVDLVNDMGVPGLEVGHLLLLLLRQPVGLCALRCTLELTACVAAVAIGHSLGVSVWGCEVWADACSALLP